MSGSRAKYAISRTTRLTPVLTGFVKKRKEKTQKLLLEQTLPTKRQTQPLKDCRRSKNKTWTRGRVPPKRWRRPRRRRCRRRRPPPPPLTTEKRGRQPSTKATKATKAKKTTTPPTTKTKTTTATANSNKRCPAAWVFWADTCLRRARLARGGASAPRRRWWRARMSRCASRNVGWPFIWARGRLGPHLTQLLTAGAVQVEFQFSPTQLFESPGFQPLKYLSMRNCYKLVDKLSFSRIQLAPLQRGASAGALGAASSAPATRPAAARARGPPQNLARVHSVHNNGSHPACAVRPEDKIYSLQWLVPLEDLRHADGLLPWYQARSTGDLPLQHTSHSRTLSLQQHKQHS